jgi:hypothetical protein
MSDARLVLLLDERDLRRSAELYAQGADRRDKALWASIFTEDGAPAAGRRYCLAADFPKPARDCDSVGAWVAVDMTASTL